MILLLRRSVTVLLAAVLLGGTGTGIRAGQVRPDGDEELRLLREATFAESGGDLEAAARSVHEVLANNPRSLGGLIHLERLLGMLDRLEQLLPHIDALLTHEPGSVVGHQMRIRALAALGRTESLEEAAQEWIAAMPAIETPYRETARAWRRQGDYMRAVRTLESGRKRIRRPDALALELGDAWADAYRFDRVAAEWARAIGPEGQAFLLVQRRVAGLTGPGSFRVIPELVELLARSPTTVPRMKAALQLAVSAGLEAHSERLANDIDDVLSNERRDAFLIEVARRADGAGLQRLAYWAYGRLVAEGVANGDADTSLALRTRLAELAWAAGDARAADAAFRSIENSLDPGSPTMRKAQSLRVTFLAQDGSFDAAREELVRLRVGLADSPEVDAAAAHLANALLDAGRVDEGELVLSGLSGPRACLARSRVRIHQGQFERARTELLSAAPRLHGAEATETIALALLLGRLSPQSAALVTRTMAATLGEQRAAVRELLSAADSLIDDERVALLEYAADLALRSGLALEAEHILREIVDSYPATMEAPHALLALARSLSARGAPAEDIEPLLERMILEYPRSALLPQARRELERLAARDKSPET
ncbi:MAG: hypothetical protein L0271_06545 [Gemmatimonadetes bacterium]|nr:hypothetical protein [Gemmatimonadota bacterium]